MSVIYAPLGRWLALLAAGWGFADWIVEPMRAHHGAHAVLLMRNDA